MAIDKLYGLLPIQEAWVSKLFFETPMKDWPESLQRYMEQTTPGCSEEFIMRISEWVKRQRD